MTDADCTLEGVTIMEPNRVGVALSLGVSVLSLLSALFIDGAGGRGAASLMRLVVFGLIGGAMGAYYFGRVARRSSKTDELVVNASGVHVGGKLLAARGDLVAGTTWRERNGATYVRLARGGLSPAVDLKVQDLADGRRLLHALQLDATQSASTFTIGAVSTTHQRATRWVAGAVTLAVLALVGGGFVVARSLQAPGPFFSIMPVLLSFAAFGAARSSASVARAVVGADGVYLRWLWQKQFIPIERIESAMVVEHARTQWQSERLVVRLHLVGNETWDIPAWSSGGRRRSRITDDMRARADMLAARINQAIEGGGGQATALLRDPTVLERGERAIGEWVVALKKLHRDADGYREPGSALDQLWAVLEDVKAKAEQRAATAVALSPHLDDEGRKRVRIAAQAAVAPRLRVALEAAADEDEAELESALEAVAEAESQ